VAERAALFGRMRDLSRRVAEAYLAQRESLAFPWGRVEPKSAVWEAAPADEAPAPLGPAPFVLEIGTEELPAADLASALEQLRESVPAMLEEARLAHGAIRVLGTPRRLVLQVEGLAPSQTEQVSEVKGPPADKAFDAEGRPTAAAQGFARSKGVAVEALRVEEVDGGRYTVAQVRQAGRTADAVLAERIPPLFEGLAFDRSMRWDGGGMVFSRPIRWLLALHGGHVVPISLAGLRAGRTTRGLRFLDPECLTVGDVEAYFAALRPQGILLDPEERSRQIKEQVDVLAGAVGGKVPDDPELQEEVTNLVEAPTALRGAFDAAYLSLPRQVLVSVLKKHQRCFAVERGGTLLPYFVSVRNGGRHHLETVAHGNEQVVRARFADAAYFVRRDLERPLEAYLPRLATLTFQAQLGSVLEKVGRVERLVDALAASLGLTPDDARVARRAAHLCKADLATNMVVEMTSLQGVMGREYALRSGEPPEVAQAIDEHYQPRHAGDSVPASRPGVAVGLADRLDTLMALFAAGLQPTGTRDPFALRRAAIGLVQILIAHQIRLDLRRSLAMAAEGLPIPAPAAADQACLDFIATRQQALLLAEGHRYDAVEAVLAAQSHDPAGAAQAVPALEAWVGRDDWAQTLQAYARCVRITRDQTEVHAVEPQRFIEEAERELHAALEGAQAGARAPGSVDDFLNAFRPMVPAITRFFDDVLVMAEDERLRLNRLGLLQRIVALASGVADLSRMEGF
jgi:glycyl-tRNA synthetase